MLGQAEYGFGDRGPCMMTKTWGNREGFDGIAGVWDLNWACRIGANSNFSKRCHILIFLDERD